MKFSLWGYFWCIIWRILTDIGISVDLSSFLPCSGGFLENHIQTDKATVTYCPQQKGTHLVPKQTDRQTDHSTHLIPIPLHILFIIRYRNKCCFIIFPVMFWGVLWRITHNHFLTFLTYSIKLAFVRTRHTLHIGGKFALGPIQILPGNSKVET